MKRINRIRASRTMKLCLLTLAAMVSATAAASPWQAASEPTLQDLIFRLVRVPGVAGYEDAVREEIAAQLPSWVQAESDSLGNLVTTFGSGTPHTILVAPLDERGYVISDITDDGYLRLYRGTRAEYPLFDQYHYGQPMMVQAASGSDVAAVSSTVSTHLAGDGPAADRNRIRGIDDLWIDLGADSRAQVEALGVRDLDPVGLRDRAIALANGRVAGPHAQGRAAAAVLQHLLAGIDGPGALEGTVTIAWVAQSTFRDLGLRHLAQRLRPDRAFLFTTASLRPRRGSEATETLTDQDRGGSGELGRGPLVVANDEALMDAASSAHIAVQNLPAEIVGRPFSLSALGWDEVEHYLIALPVRYAHTPVELVDSSDVASATALLLAVLGAPSTPNVSPIASQVGPRPASELVDAIAGARPAVDGSFRTLQPLIEAYGVAEHEEDVRELILDMLPAWAEPAVDDEGNITIHRPSGRDRVRGYGDSHRWERRPANARRRHRCPLRSPPDPGAHFRGRAPRGAHASPRLHRGGGVQPQDITSLARGRSRHRVRRGDRGTGRCARRRGDRGEALSTTCREPRHRPVRRRSRWLRGNVDDRVGCAAMILALQRLDPSALLDRRVTFAFSIEEETGLVGASTIAGRTDSDVVFSVDTFVSSASPVDWQRRARVPLGTGPVLKVMDGNHVTPRSAVDRLLEVAGPRGIPVSLSITGGGTDAGAFVPYGSVPVPIGWPSRYSHSPVELMDQVDLDQLIDLILALAYEY